MSLEWPDLFLLFLEQNPTIVEFDLKLVIGCLQLGNALVGVGLLQFDETPV